MSAVNRQTVAGRFATGSPWGKFMSYRPTLAVKLIGACAVIILAMLGLGATVWSLLTTQAQHAEAVVEHRVPQLERVADIQLNVTRVSLQLRHAMLARDQAELSATLADIAALKEHLDRQLDEFGKAMTTDAGRRAYAKLPGLMANFWQVGGKNLELIQAGRKAEAFAFLVNETIPARKQLLEPLNAEMARQGERTKLEVDDAAEQTKSARNLVVCMVGIVALAMGGLLVLLLKVVRQLGAEPDELRRAAEAVADGHLAHPIQLREGDSTSVMAALKKMTERLASAVQAVRGTAETVAQASAQIASGNGDLSARTEQQAAALQETAASMEQLSGTVRQNAENARMAHQLAGNSSSVASEGGAMVGQVVTTMREIQDSSRRIADIIAVIDSIAFQTNILALNAAVEAARAGDQGRGFAVVASEVRGLAKRSATAAQEIKALITDSVSRVEHGTSLADEAGIKMQEIVGAIQHVNAVVSEISAASVQQSQGVAQIGEAVTQMDRSTQQNAALVEESAAAAESLRDQARQLVSAVAVFRTG